MTYGIKVVNESGDTVIDDNYRNPLLVASGTGTIAPDYGANTHSFTTQTVCTPIVFVRPNSDGIYIGGATISKTAFQVICNGSYEWAVFGLTGPASDGSTFGLRVFDPAGNLVFGSMYRPPRIKQVLAQDMPLFVTGAPATYPSFPYTLSASGVSGRPWLCLNSLPFIPRDQYTSPAAAISGSNVILRIGDYGVGAWAWGPNSEVSAAPAWGTRFRMALAQT